MSAQTPEVIDKFYSYKRSKAEYPYLLLDKGSDVIAILLSGLEKGDLPIACTFEGKVIKKDGGISRTPITINKILQVVGVTVILSETDKRPITNIEELIEMEEFKWGESDD